MTNKFIRVGEVAKELEVSIPYAYKLIKKLNDELEAKGFITIAGRVSRQYLKYPRLAVKLNGDMLILCLLFRSCLCRIQALCL